MTLRNDREPVVPSPRWVALLASAALALAACSGDSPKNGSEGPTGPVGPPGPPPAGGGVPVTSAQFIRTAIVSANVPEDGKPVIEVRLQNEAGQPLNGLAAANISFVLARLEPGVNGKSSTWHAITRRTEAFPGTPAPTRPEAVTGTGPTNQATTEAATQGKWVEGNQANGIYYYTFAQSLKGISDIPYDPSLVHRVGLEIRLRPEGAAGGYIPANNAVFTWSPTTGGEAESGREIVDDDTCNACHDQLAFHGGPRRNVQYCAMCHESYSFDAQTGNTIDLKVMIHKIHRDELPTGPYGIFGYGNEYHDYSHVQFPQDQRNCETCHDESDPDTPQASNWRLTANRESCGSCHNDVNFDTGVGHGGVAATDDQCFTCHGPNSNFGVRTDLVHYDPLLRAGEAFRYEVLNVVDSAPGQTPTVTIRVTDPTNGNQPYDIKAADSPFQVGSSSLRVDLAFSTRPDFTNTGSGSATATTGAPAQPITIDFKANGVPDPAYPGGFKATATVPIPATATGSGSALLEGHPNVEIDGSLTSVPVVSAGKTFAITDAKPVAYREVVDINKCNDCHKLLSLHGENRAGNVELCAACHNPNATDINRRVAGSSCESVTGTLDDQSIDFKVLVHAIHAGEIAGYKVCGFGNSGYDFSHVKYPGDLRNCEGCHLPDTYYPPDASTAFATTFDAAPAANPDRSTPLGDVATTPATAVCSSCHTSQAARSHMLSAATGGSTSAIKAADSTTPGTPAEGCANCHGPGKDADVKQVHGVAGFIYN